MNHASLMVLRKLWLLKKYSSAIETDVVTNSPVAAQILFDDPPPMRAAGIRTGLSVRPTINAVYPFLMTSTVKSNSHILDYDDVNRSSRLPT